VCENGPPTRRSPGGHTLVKDHEGFLQIWPTNGLAISDQTAKGQASLTCNLT